MTRKQASGLVQALFESWGPSLVRYAFRATGSRELADDVVQEAFMGLYRELRKGASVENPKGWTLVAVRNHISKHWRSQRRHGEELHSQQLLEAIPDQEATWKHAECREVLQLLSVLTPREEEVMLLRLQSLKYREIASELGISEKSVATSAGESAEKAPYGSSSQVERVAALVRREESCSKHTSVMCNCCVISMASSPFGLTKQSRSI